MADSFVTYLSDNNRQAMVDLLNSRLADTVDLTLAVKQAHWNVKGPSFIGIHELLDEVADRLRESADTMAERCVVLGGQAKGTTQTVASETSLSAYPEEAQNQVIHVDALTERFKQLGRSLADAIQDAAEAGDEETADLFTEVSRTIDKDAWFIGAHNDHGTDAP